MKNHVKQTQARLDGNGKLESKSFGKSDAAVDNMTDLYEQLTTTIQ